MDPEFLRLFVALPVPETVRERIAEFGRELSKQMSPATVRWTPVEQIHLTLTFLGKVAAAAVPELRAALDRATRGIGPFQLAVAQAGAFPSIDRARVIWIGLAGDAAPLLRLQDQVARATATLCEKEERRGFSPHLTIGRVREGERKIGSALKSTTLPQCEPWKADTVHLMHSRLSPHGAVHTPLAEFRL